MQMIFKYWNIKYKHHEELEKAGKEGKPAQEEEVLPKTFQKVLNSF